MKKVVIGVLIILVIFLIGFFSLFFDDYDFYQKGGNFSNDPKPLVPIIHEPSNFLTIGPSQLKIDPNEKDAVHVIVFNEEDYDLNVSLRTYSIKEDPFLECLFADTFSENSDHYIIHPEKYAGVPLVVTELGGEGRTTGCKVEVIGAPEGATNQGALIVSVV